MTQQMMVELGLSLNGGQEKCYVRLSMCCWKNRFGDEERTVMHLVPAAAVRLMKRRVLSRPGVRPLLYHGTPVRLEESQPMKGLTADIERELASGVSKGVSRAR